MKLSNGKTYCRVYPNRIGVIIGKNEKGKVYCGLREFIKKDFKGCPFNKGYEEVKW